MKTLIVCSGGIESGVLVYYKKYLGYEPVLFCVNYGQYAFEKELEAVKSLSALHSCDYRSLDISSLGEFLTSQLTTGTGKTYVPNRNTILLAIAFGAAVSAEIHEVSAGMQSVGPIVAPDNKPEFIMSFAEMQEHALRGKLQVKLSTPFLYLSKGQVIGLAEEYKLGVDYTKLWSCFENTLVHCGVCLGCIDRKNGFKEAGIVDPTRYQ